MSGTNRLLEQYWLQILISSILFVCALVCFWFVPVAGFGLAIICLIPVALLMAPMLATIGANLLSSQFVPSDVEATPATSIPEARRKEGAYQEAYDGYAELALEFPEDSNLVATLLEIAIVDLNDLPLAQQALDAGLANMPADEDRKNLRDLYYRLVGKGAQADRAGPLAFDQDLLDPPS